MLTFVLWEVNRSTNLCLSIIFIEVTRTGRRRFSMYFILCLIFGLDLNHHHSLFLPPLISNGLSFTRNTTRLSFDLEPGHLVPYPWFELSNVVRYRTSSYFSTAKEGSLYDWTSWGWRSFSPVRWKDLCCTGYIVEFSCIYLLVVYTQVFIVVFVPSVQCSDL